MTLAAETCPHGFSERQGREAARAVVRKLSDLELPPDPATELPTVEQELGLSEPLPAGDTWHKFDRYAFGAGAMLNLFLPHVVQGDGPEAARFTNFVEAEVESGATPYHHFRKSIQETFRHGWRQYTVEHPVASAWAIRHYHTLLENDSTSSAGGSALDEKLFEVGAETGPELAYYGLMVGVARNKHPTLRDASEDVLLTVARQASKRLIRRGRFPLRFTFWGRIMYQLVDYDAIELEQISDSWRLTSRDGVFDTYDPSKDTPAIGPTVRCMADLLYLTPNDRYTAMENTVFAGINALDKYNLFVGDTAMATWKKHKAVAKRVKSVLPHLIRAWAATEDTETVSRRAAAYAYDQLAEII